MPSAYDGLTCAILNASHPTLPSRLRYWGWPGLQPVPDDVSAARCVAVSVGYWHVCVLLESDVLDAGVVRCWGVNPDPDYDMISSGWPTGPVGGPSGHFSSVIVGGKHT